MLRLPQIHRVNRAAWRELMRFCIVGASGYVVNLVVFKVLLDFGGLHYLMASVGAFCVAWVNNFALNRHWTFQKGHRPAMTQGGRYLAVSLLALAINLVVLRMLVGWGAGKLVSQAIAVLVVTPVAFLLNRRWAFR